ncbi:MAG: family 43 glycosylhydrolase [Clostridium sp.]|nr:family 43 glycosylhydrolase [Clostridium sp.]
MRIKYLTGVFCALLCAVAPAACNGQNPEPKEDEGLQSETPKPTNPKYVNPVIDGNMPDPTIVEGDDGWFYVLATESNRELPIYRSKNLTDWEYVAAAFTPEERPDFVEGAGIWAPDITRVGDKYLLHFSMSKWGGEWTCGIGSAWSDSPEGPFHDARKMFISNEINVQNCIDPFFIEEDGKNYIFFGSFSGIYMLELTDDGLEVKPGSKPVQIAGRAYEGTYIHKRDGKYYLFASVGTCCEGINSTYSTVVGRADELTGPYVDREGRPMLENNHEVVIRKNSSFVGTGHNSEIVTDKAGHDWILYHAFQVSDPDSRKLMLDRVYWTVDGWPTVKGGTPSVAAQRPEF